MNRATLTDEQILRLVRWTLAQDGRGYELRRHPDRTSVALKAWDPTVEGPVQGEGFHILPDDSAESIAVRLEQLFARIAGG